MKRVLFFTAMLLFVQEQANGGFIFPGGFAQTSATPANFQNSTVLSVAIGPTGEVFASNGLNISTVPFDGSEGTSSAIPFVTSHLITEGLSILPDGTLLLLQDNFSGPGDVRQYSGGSYSQFAQFESSRGNSRSIAVDSNGNVAVTGTYGSIGDPGWVLGFDSAGALQFDVDVADAPVASDFDSHDDLFFATFDGGVFSVSNTGSIAPFAHLSSNFVGAGVGYVESFAIDNDDNVFLGVNLGQRFGANSSAIIRLSSTGEERVLAYGVGDIPIDMTFGPLNELYIASFNPSGSSVLRVLDNGFGSNFLEPGVSGGEVVPEPASIAIWSGISIAGLIGFCRRKRELSRMKVSSTVCAEGRG